MSHALYHLIIRLNKSNTQLFQKDFITTWEKTGEDIEAVLSVAEALTLLYQQNISTRTFDAGMAGTLIDNVQHQSGFPFAIAVNSLGLAVQKLEAASQDRSHQPSERLLAEALQCEALGIDNTSYYHSGNEFMRALSEQLDQRVAEGSNRHRPALINLQCDLDQPVQSMADLLYLKERFGGLPALKGKKLAVTWTTFNQPAAPISLPQSVIGLLSRLGMHIVLAHPEGYDIHPDVLGLAEKQSGLSEGSIRVSNSMDLAMSNADIVYPMHWAPFSILEQRDELRATNDQGVTEFEATYRAYEQQFTDWNVTEERMKLTKGGAGLMLNGASTSIRPYMIAAMILTSRFPKPAAILEKMFGDRRWRVLQ